MARPTVDTLDTRLTAVEERMHVFEFEQQQLKAELQSNTRLTEDVHGNTTDLVEFMGDAKRFFRRSMVAGQWLTATCGGGYALFELAKVVGWWV